MGGSLPRAVGLGLGPSRQSSASSPQPADRPRDLISGLGAAAPASVGVEEVGHASPQCTSSQDGAPLRPGPDLFRLRSFHRPLLSVSRSSGELLALRTGFP